MARPKKCKIIDLCIEHDEFISNSSSDDFIFLSSDELQVIKLKDIDWFGCVLWGQKMWISKSTFANIYNEAHKKISKALINWVNIKFKC